jgi:phage/plasmid-associated DNA primase
MNNKPSLNDFDGGIARRLSITEFPHKFVETPVLSHERHVDHTLEAEFRQEVMKQEMMLMLLEIHATHIRKSLCIEKPLEIRTETEEYLLENNVVKMFIEEYIEITRNANDIIIFSDMHNDFKTVYPSSKKQASWFKDQMSSYGLKASKHTCRGRYHNKIVFVGVKMKQHEDNEDIQEMIDIE